MGPKVVFPVVRKLVASRNIQAVKAPIRVPLKTHLKSPSTKVVTDIDDTVKSSGGVKLFGIALGGIDTQFRRGDFYPGAFQFAFELSSSVKNAIPENVAVLTARARELKFFLALKPKDKICSGYRAVGLNNGFGNWGIGLDQVFYGSIMEWIRQERKGIRKLANFEILVKNDASNNRNCNYILVGDTGEKDEEAGERIAMKFGQKLIPAIFLHCVTSNPDRSLFFLPKDRLVNGIPIFYFRTYVGAASKAYQCRLISLEGLNRVIDAARFDLTAVENKLSPQIRVDMAPILASRRDELERDIMDAKRVKKSTSFTSTFLSPNSNTYSQKFLDMMPK